VNQPVVVLLVGLPGSGKLTAATALTASLRASGSEVRLVDNHHVHHVADPVLALVEQDGRAPLPRAVWARVAEVREAVLRTVEELSPPSWSFVFTADLDDSADDLALVQRLAALADRRGARFTVVRLHCELDELRRRIVTPSRRQRHKSVSEADAVERYAAGVPALAAWSPVTLDVTRLTEDETAARVLAAVLPPPPG
jgi:tRNA uridine 5-carbamoylmethylation protein Kti12